MTIKIAHIQLLPLLTGVQRVSLDELTRLNRSDFTPYMICQQSGPMTEECENNNITCLYTPTLVREISPLKDIKAFWHLYRLFRKYKFDIVHTHSSKTGVIGRLAAKLAGVPMIVHTVHGYAFPAAKSKLEKNIFLAMEWLGNKCSDKIICLHDADKKIAEEALGAKASQLIVLANGVNINKFNPPTIEQKQDIRTKLNLPFDAIVIGMVGRLWQQKNPKLLLTAAIAILKDRKNVHFVFAGDGELRAELEDKVNALGLSSNIHFLGWRNDTESVLKAFDIFVLPSLWEGMPLAILEAQATGLPCIVSNIQGNNHLVSNEQEGFLFDLENDKQLVNQLLSLISDPELRYKMGQNGLNNVNINHNISHRIENIAQYYKGLN
ncbi:glycosyltransferase family 4 protein [Photobacterium carnosum]|uniref:glycosyltransferase family 4 protein n=1 Tax=Photobacterium carnosum TaxID=2023717 RepID=UPI001E3E7989|nr:glycosyltransferase family 4 protein [Photobacterium carnosum]MCD9526019.1 glycosyltransferase [Photobacterium carnosum]